MLWGASSASVYPRISAQRSLKVISPVWTRQSHRPMPEPAMARGELPLALPQRRLRPRAVGQLALDRVVQPGVLDGDGGVVGEEGQGCDLGGGVGPGLRCIEYEDADEPLPKCHGQAEIGDEVVALGMVGKAHPGIGPTIGERQRLAGGGHLAGEALAHRHHELGGLGDHSAFEVTVEQLGGLVQKEETHGGGLGNGPRLVDDAAEGLLDIERRLDRPGRPQDPLDLPGVLRSRLV